MRNIGIFAHVDAGKTTLTERLLYASGAINAPGSVDSGTAHTDTLEAERARGLSVRAAAAPFVWKNTRFMVIDTPGHADFSSEVERSLWALDGAILVVSAAEGVQAQTEILAGALRECGIPTLIFVNKTDRDNADVEGTLKEIHEMLSIECGRMDNINAAMELLAQCDDDALEDYLGGKTLPMEEITHRLAPHVAACAISPAFVGSALKGEGIVELLDGIIALLPPPNGKINAPICGVVFRIFKDAVMGRGAYVRMFQGEIRNRDAIDTPSGVRKITQIRAITLDGKNPDVGRLSAGEVGLVYGISDCRVGQILGDEIALPRRVKSGSVRTPLLDVQILPSDPAKMRALHEAMLELEAEDPLLRVTWFQLTGTLNVSVMGTIQLEILAGELKSRFGIDADFSPPKVIYKETIAAPGTGFYAYTMPKPCWAVLDFYLEPGVRGSGVTFMSEVAVRDIPTRYQHQVKQALPIALKQGLLGWEVTDIVVRLIGGEDHYIHTHPLDFIVATPIALFDGLKRCGQQLLEPMLDVRFTLPESLCGRLMSDVLMMRGVCGEHASNGGRVTIEARIPVATSMDYPVKLAAYTGGRGVMAAKFGGYEPCELSQGATCPRRGVNPLDTAKYILAARSALDGGIFDI